MAINNNSALSNVIAPVGNSKLSIQVGDMRLQSTYVFEGRQTRYAEGWNVPITPSKGAYKSYVGFKALEGVGAEITHVRLCGELHEELQLIELPKPAILGQTLWSEMPQQVQNYYLKVVEEVAAKQSEKEQQIAQVEQKISEIFEKYPSAYVVFDLYGRTEKQEDDDYHTFSLYCPIETDEWGPIEGYVYASRSQHRHGSVLLDELERAISKKIDILVNQAALLAAHPNCYVENNKLYAKVEYKGVQKTLWLGNNPSSKEYEADLLRFKKSVDYQLQKEQEEKEFKAKWQARNEGVAAIILKRFPKAQIIKEPHYSGWWCVNTPRTDMLTFCKQNKLLVPKHLLP